MSVTRKCKRVSLPVLRPEYLNTRDFVVTNLPKRRNHLSQRKNPETRQQSVSILELIARTIFSVVDVKDLNQIRIERFDHLQRGIACVKMNTVDNQSEVFSINFAHDLGGKIQCRNAAVSLSQEFKSKRNVVRC